MQGRGGCQSMHDASLHAPPTHTALPALMVEQLPVIGKRGLVITGNYRGEVHVWLSLWVIQ